MVAALLLVIQINLGSEGTLPGLVSRLYFAKGYMRDEIHCWGVSS